MGLILDTSVLISGERGGASVEEILASLSSQYGQDRIEISVVSIHELTHGMYRAKSPTIAARRRSFVDDVKDGFKIYDLTTEIAALSGRIEGEQAAQGIAIAFPDLIIGSTALHLGYSVLTSNTKHFSLIPNLQVLSF